MMERLAFLQRDQDYKLTWPLHHRDACRGIMFRDGKLAMICSAKYGDYKFPGGGVEPGEDFHAALRREVREEGGIIINGTMKEFGYVEEIGSSTLHQQTIFHMNSYYYFCEIETIGETQLDEYEKDYGYELRFVTIEEALIQNKKLFDQEKTPWVRRENEVLSLLKSKREGLYEIRNII